MLGESKNQFSLTCAALSTFSAQKQLPINRNMRMCSRIKKVTNIKVMTKGISYLFVFFATSVLVHAAAAGSSPEKPLEFFSPSQTKYLKILLILIIPAALSQLYRKFQLSTTPRHTVSVTLSSGEKIRTADVLVTLNAQAVQAVRDGVQGTSPPLAAEVEGKLAAKEQAYLQKTKDKARAGYAVNTFRAHVSGRMQQLMPSAEPKPTPDDFDTFVSSMFGIQEQEGIPHLAAQLRLFYQKCPPQGRDEALVGWGDRHILTTHRLVITSAGRKPTLERDIPLSEIRKYYVSGIKQQTPQGIMKYRLLEKATVHSASNSNSSIVAELQPGDQVMVRATVASEADKWDAVTLSGGQMGYLSSKTKGHTLSSNTKYRLDEMATVYSIPSTTSPSVAQLQADDEVTVEAAITVEGAEWAAVALSSGKTGYLPGRTKRRDAESKPDRLPNPQS